MKALVIGGARHGDWVDLLDGVQAWVDLTTATTYRLRHPIFAATDFATGEPTDTFVIHLAVHPDLIGPNEPQVVPALLTSFAMNEFARAHGETMPKTPDTPAELVVPDEPKSWEEYRK